MSHATCFVGAFTFHFSRWEFYTCKVNTLHLIYSQCKEGGIDTGMHGPTTPPCGHPPIKHPLKASMNRLLHFYEPASVSLRWYDKYSCDAQSVSPKFSFRPCFMYAEEMPSGMHQSGLLLIRQSAPWIIHATVRSLFVCILCIHMRRHRVLVFSFFFFSPGSAYRKGRAALVAVCGGEFVRALQICASEKVVWVTKNRGLFVFLYLWTH